MRDDELIKEKMKFFMDEKIRVHVKKLDNYFYNGLIVEKKSESVYVFEDRKLGQVNLFLSDIKDVVEFKEVLDL